ncbi:LssY C-terminal domain-containing protein [Arcanobacterium buesumense]|uniref:LssY-like C-terminal domain-containing protein n=1 Tax=Arcanobacterium buesumense TaxID=2722751 RepID=A0A6H2ELZ2_9ACTO|nr:LssY C-terminal domain-containing protein [Arcanobacterium buesumense]QJC22094.1 hypothetical protein HC352_05960 [Arcanobacterium buesumense]
MSPSQHYPIPTQVPIYSSREIEVPAATRRSLSQIIGGIIFIFALLCAAWLIILIALRITQGSWLFNLAVFWAVLTYLVLPRLHQIFTYLYVPDYFIGRTRTTDGVLGDPINLAFDGDANDIRSAMQHAGWIEADPITVRSSIGIVMSTLRRRPYPSAPVSTLKLFGRKQTFAFQQEVGGNAAKRHHIRFWHVPDGWLLPGGQKVGWLAAATYDRSVGLNVFTLQVTHKIDADIDAERDYVINTLRYADPENKVRVIENFSTAYQAWNGGGDLVETDGHLPVVDVTGSINRTHYQLPQSQHHSHAIPPIPLAFSTILVAILFLSTINSVLNAQAYAWFNFAISIALFIALVFTFLRRRWAWFILMGHSAILAFSLLLATSYAPHGNEEPLTIIALTVLVLVTISDEKVRLWVSEKEATERNEFAAHPQ